MLLFLFNSVLSYFFAYKHCIIIADQRNHIISKLHTVFILISNFLQMIMLLLFSSYIFILIIQIIIRKNEIKDLYEQKIITI